MSYNNSEDYFESNEFKATLKKNLKKLKGVDRK